MTKIVNDTGLPLEVVRAADRGEGRLATIVVKATFDIVDQRPATLAKEQRPILPDTKFMDELGRSLAWASDRAPWKPNTGFTIVGAFHQPEGKPGLTGRARFSFGPLRKELLFFGPRRAVQQPDGAWVVEHAAPMTSVPLRWELSLGGLADPRNPFGMGQKVEEVGGRRVVMLPQIEQADRTAPPEPANFTFVPSNLLQRRRKLGTRDQEWALFRAPLLPLDYDASWHNAAPQDQQAGDYPRGDEAITLVNLHPALPKLGIVLPGVRVRVAVLRQQGAALVPEEVPMVIDTVIAAPEENQVVLLFRGRVPVQGAAHESELPWLECVMEPLGAKPLDLPAQVLARARAVEAVAAAKAAEAEAFTQAEIAKLLPKAGLPPELAALVAAGGDPMRVFDALEAHITAAAAAVMKRLPPA